MGLVLFRAVFLHYNTQHIFPLFFLRKLGIKTIYQAINLILLPIVVGAMLAANLLYLLFFTCQCLFQKKSFIFQSWASYTNKRAGSSEINYISAVSNLASSCANHSATTAVQRWDFIVLESTSRLLLTYGILSIDMPVWTEVVHITL